MEPNFKQFFHTNDALQSIYKDLEHIKARKPHLHGDKFMADFVCSFKFSYAHLNKILESHQTPLKVNKGNTDLFNNVFFSHIKTFITTDLKNNIRNVNNVSVRQELNSSGINIKILSQTELYSVENVFEFYQSLAKKDEQYETDEARYAEQYARAIEIEIDKVI